MSPADALAAVPDLWARCQRARVHWQDSDRQLGRLERAMIDLAAAINAAYVGIIHTWRGGNPRHHGTVQRAQWLLPMAGTLGVDFEPVVAAVELVESRLPKRV